MRNIISKFIFVFAIVLGLSTFGFSQDMMKKDEMKKDEMKKDEIKKDAMMKGEMAKEDTRPVVAIIKASWCPACRKLDPTMMKLMEEYGEKLNFVVFDVSNDETKKEAMKMAEEKGLADFFNENKDKTSTVAIFKEKKKVFSTKYNTDKETYVKEFEKALK
ncbi:MAG: pentapeptide MXKDX repeat protein [Pyrinomonadaceae bacterium]|jgi:pentapeptide MXKDX repeat protein|nr:pentapeptide MXKDX repeat protein [Pyrinomonadaceae bacterium]